MRERGAPGTNWHGTVAYAATSPLPVDQVATRAASAAVQDRTGIVLALSGLSRLSVDLEEATAEQARVMRAVVWEVVGNPFRPVDFTSWRTATAVAMARQMYESREFSAMPILADALQDAGCNDEDVLNHCRAPGEHFRGCWVVDGVLEKE